jgi:cytochrome c-type biogenesis protein CcmH
MRLAPVVALAALALLAVACGGARQAPSEVAADVSGSVMSPFCPGLTLHDCPSEAAADLRARVDRWARSGLSEAQIRDRLESEYGPSIAAAPKAHGAGLLVWLLPAAALLAGAALIVVTARRWSGAGRNPRLGPAGAAPSPEERARLEAELARLRAET